MYWLTRPPYGRWLAACAVVAAALYMDLTGPAMETYPYVAADAAPGETISVEWRRVPRGVLPAHGAVPEVADEMLLKGLPLVPGIGSSARPAPDDWWAIEVPLPNGAVPGGEALVVMRDSSRRVAAVVLRAPSVGSFGATAPGLVAVPLEDAVAVAQAVGEQRATVLLRP